MAHTRPTTKPKKKRRWLRAFAWLIVIVAFTYLSFAADIFLYSKRTASTNADTAIVLGAAAYYNKPSPVFEERIKHAINLYKQGKVKKIVFTGGHGSEEEPAESEVARSYAIRHGVPAQAIAIETESKTTLENLKNAAPLLAKEESTLIVSDPIHMRRAMLMASDVGIQAEPSPTPTTRYRSLPVKLEFLNRETFFMIGHQLRRLNSK